MAAAKKSEKKPSGIPITPVRDDSPVYVVCGAEAFLRREALRQLLRRLEAADSATEFDASSIQARSKEDDTDDNDADVAEEADESGPPAMVTDIFDAVRTADLFASRNVVLVRSADGFISKARAMLEIYLESPAAGSVLILESKSFPSNTKLYKRVTGLGGTIACNALFPKQVPDWATQRAAQVHDKKLDADAAEALQELVGTDLGSIDSELSKLASYVGDRPRIGRADVEELVGSSRVELVFGVTDAIGRGDARAALERWDRVLANDRDAPYRAVGGLAFGVRRLAEAERFVALGGDAWAATTRFGLRMEPAALTRQLQRLTRGRLENMLRRLRQIDAASKSGGGDVQQGVEKFIVEFAARP